MEKQIIVFGDIEMGAGNLTDDFISDEALSNLILEFSRRENPIDLVFNGDTFDFLKCPSLLFPKTFYPRHISRDVSLAKLALIYKAHQKVFDTLSQFVSREGKVVYFLVGNHDQDLIYPEVQEEISRLLGHSQKVQFPGLKYSHGSVYIEHGQQYDLVFKANFEKLFLKHKGESILNFPFVTFGLISAAMRLKEEHPFVERIFPRPELLTHHRVVLRKISKHTLGYFFKSLMYYPFRFYSDPTYTFPTNLFRELYKRMLTVHWDVDDITNIFKRKKRNSKYKIYVLGHIHEKRIARGKKKIIIHPGSWRDEYEFQSKTRELVPRTKRYIEITERDGEESFVLVDVPIRRSVFDFDEVLKDEKRARELAAREENYVLKA